MPGPSLAAISGRVVEGDKLGRPARFPDGESGCGEFGSSPERRLFRLLNSERKSISRGGSNIGLRPTVAAGKPAASEWEAHLWISNGDIYGEELEVQIGGKFCAASVIRFLQMTLRRANKQGCFGQFRKIGFDKFALFRLFRAIYGCFWRHYTCFFNVR